MSSLFDLFSDEGYHTHPAVRGEWCCLTGKYQARSLFLDLPELGCAGPDFIPRDVDMMLHRVTIELVGPAIRDQRSKEGPRAADPSLRRRC